MMDCYSCRVIIVACCNWMVCSMFRFACLVNVGERSLAATWSRRRRVCSKKPVFLFLTDRLFFCCTRAASEERLNLKWHIFIWWCAAVYPIRCFWCSRCHFRATFRRLLLRLEEEYATAEKEERFREKLICHKGFRSSASTRDVFRDGFICKWCSSQWNT